jgi:hypothetical protein
LGEVEVPDATGLKTLGSGSKATPNKGISAIINDHRGTRREDEVVL